jgi:hypothetical protein
MPDCPYILVCPDRTMDEYDDRYCIMAVCSWWPLVAEDGDMGLDVCGVCKKIFDKSSCGMRCCEYDGRVLKKWRKSCQITGT